MNDTGWISVDDRLPPTREETWTDGEEIHRHRISEPVLCFCVGDDEHGRASYCLDREADFRIGFLDTDAGTGGYIGGWVDDSDGNTLRTVTHWRPLPAPPAN